MDEISKRGERELKKLGGRTYNVYNYDKSKPITDRLKKKLNKVKPTIDYKKYQKKYESVAGNMRTAIPSAISVAPHPALHSSGQN